MRKKKIAVCFTQIPFVRGGAELHVEALCAQMKLRGYDAELVGIPFKWYPPNEILKHALAWRMVDLSESNGEKIDMVIGTKFPSYLVRHGKKVVWLIHQYRVAYDLLGTEFCDLNLDDPDQQMIIEDIRRIDNIALSEAGRIYTNAKNTASRLKKYNNIDGIPLYHPPSLVGRYRFDKIGDYILSVGRLDTIKRVDLLIEALQHAGSNIRCIVAGTGPVENELRKLVRASGLESRVTFAGFVDDDRLLDLYAGCSAVYFAPFDEDYGYITLEAFLSRKPVITTTDAGGVLEFVIDQVNGLVCSPVPQEIGAAIEKVGGNKALAEEYGANGYELVKDISWDNAIERLTETLR